MPAYTMYLADGAAKYVTSRLINTTRLVLLFRGNFDISADSFDIVDCVAVTGYRPNNYNKQRAT